MDHIEGIPEGYRLGALDDIQYADHAETIPTYISFELIPIERKVLYQCDCKDCADIRRAQKEKVAAIEQPKPDLAALIERARNHVPTEQEKREQAISFVYGNLTLDGCNVTREMVAAEYDKLTPQQPKQLEAVIDLSRIEGCNKAVELENISLCQQLAESQEREKAAPYGWVFTGERRTALLGEDYEYEYGVAARMMDIGSTEIVRILKRKAQASAEVNK